MESGLLKSVVLLGSGILCMVLLELLGALGSAVGVDFLEAMAETLSGVVFVVYLVGVLALLHGDGNMGAIFFTCLRKRFFCPGDLRR